MDDETKTLTSIVKQDSEKSSSLSSVITTNTTTTTSSSDFTTASANSSNGTRNKLKICKKKVYLENLEWNVHENLLKNFLKKYGSIRRIKVIRDTNTNKSKGCGYVEFTNEKDAEALVAVATAAASSNSKSDTLVLNMRPIRASFYREKAKPKTKSITNSQFNQSENVEKPLQHSREESKMDEDTTTTTTTTTTEPNGSIVNTVPYNVLVKIFSYLCLRDRCIAEQGEC